MSKKKIVIVILILLICFLVIIGAKLLLNLKPDKQENVKIQGYDYQLEDRDTKLYQDKFLELKQILEQEQIDKQEYAKLVSELYLIDLYTIDNKTSKYDVGSLEFICQEDQEEFKNKVMDTIYKLVEDNSTNTRKQNLPIVKNTEVVDIKEIEYKKQEETLPGYE